MYKGWTRWNVALWLDNDESLWREKIHFIRYARTKDEAAKMMLAMLHDRGIYTTPDGARYSVKSIRAAMRD